MNGFAIAALGLVLATGASAGSLDSLAFIQGCWGTVEADGTRVTEDWFSRSNNAMLGVSRTVDAAGDLAEYEFLEIRSEEATGKVNYTPFLNGHRLNTFALEKPSGPGDANAATFVDFSNSTLKKIAYQGLPDHLRISLSGNSRDGSPFEFSYELKREDCRSRF
jgi:hypothetical protein